MLSRKAVVNLKGFSTAIRLECSFLPQPVFFKNVHEGGGKSPLALKWHTQLLLLVLYTSTVSGASCHTYFEEMKAVWAKKGVFVLIAPLEYTTLNLFIENSVALLLGVYR